MKYPMRASGVLMIVALVLGGAGCNGDSPTENGQMPTISDLAVGNAQRITGSEGLLGFTFSYADPDADVDRITFQVEGGPTAVNALSDARQESGVTGVQQAVDLPDPGTEVAFSIFVIDHRGNRSNTLEGTFIAP